ncbi:2-oxo acid dehydrogenase subunit E2 [Spongiactinospora sp. 9N601]|uniref:2-oxo acid dehydrogenase subunit E2 n=1 Tax=Spongiactinospora sp. 9N601 TaxID=3375149 RepID=UPI00378FDCF1
MAEIRVPKLNSNDSAYVLVEWLAEAGRPVAAGEPVATVETSKALEELAAEADGVLEQQIPAGRDIAPGTLIGRIVEPGAEPPVRPGAEGAVVRVREMEPEAPAQVITAPARELIERLGLAPELVRTLDVKIVRRVDVERLAADAGRSPAEPPNHSDVPLNGPRAGTGGQPARQRPNAGTRPAEHRTDADRLSPGQRAVARAVTLSHREIPAAYTLISVDAGAALALAAELTRRMRRFVGLPELLVRAIGRQFAAMPHLFATPVEGLSLRRADHAHVGVTIDVGRGLFTPVVTEASRRTLEEIVEELSAFRRTAVTGAFRESELAGGNIVVALHHDRDIVAAIPIVYPGQLVALSIAGRRKELTLGDGGRLTERTMVNLGAAYDHRFVNGQDATRFLRALKDDLEDPIRLTGHPSDIST